MKHTLKKLEKSQVELNITVEPSEYDKHLKNASVRISQRTAIKGFRAGKAPYDIIKKEIGEMAIMQEALENIIQEAFYNTIKSEKLDTIGMPEIKVEKAVPGNELVFTATVALLPKVKLPDLTKIKIKKNIKEVTDQQVDEVLENLTKMQAKEVIKNGKAGETDKLVIDMELYLDKVPIDGGTARDYQVYLSEDHYIPGFAKALVGLKKDDEKEFSLPFPKNYYNKQLAGNTGDFKIKVKDVYERQFATLDDEFAKTLGQENLTKLKELIKNNLTHEAEHKAEEQVEIEIFDTLIEKAEFDVIPEVLIDAERKKMFYELQRDLEKNGISIEKYLEDIKKKEEDLFNEFKERAEKRAKAALLSRQVTIDNDIEISDEELDREINMMKDVYKDNKEYLENLKRPEVKESIYNMLANKKAVIWLKNKVMEGEKHECKKEELKKNPKDSQEKQK